VRRPNSVVKLNQWPPKDLDGQPVSFDFEVDGKRLKGEGVFQVTELPTGVYLSILVVEPDHGATRCLELYQLEANQIVKSAQSAGFVCYVTSASSD